MCCTYTPFTTEMGFSFISKTQSLINVKRKLTAIIGIIFDTWVITHCVPLDVFSV